MSFSLVEWGTLQRACTVGEGEKERQRWLRASILLWLIQNCGGARTVIYTAATDPYTAMNELVHASAVSCVHCFAASASA